MYVLVVCSGCCDFVWFISLVLFMVVGIDGGRGMKCGSMETIYFLGLTAGIV
jgi:hypothetical protein